MTAPPPGVDVKPMWRAKDFLRWGALGAGIGLAVNLVAPLVFGLSPLASEDPSIIATWAGITLLGVAVAWMPGSTRAAKRARGALFGTDDEVARLKYRVLRGRRLELTPEEVARGRHLARVTYSSSIAEFASGAALIVAFIVMRAPQLLRGDSRLVDIITVGVGGVVVVVAGFISVRRRRRRSARRFLDETA